MTLPPQSQSVSTSQKRLPFRRADLPHSPRGARPRLSPTLSSLSVLLLLVVARTILPASTLSFSAPLNAHRLSPSPRRRPSSPALASVGTCTCTPGNNVCGDVRPNLPRRRRRLCAAVTFGTTGLGRGGRSLLLQGLRAGASENEGGEEGGGAADDLTKPPYEIEPLPVRVGHGFDIHRMAPLEEAGQPVVIAGVEIPHGDQKWVDVEGRYVQPPGSTYSTQLGVVAHSDGDVVYHSIVDAIFGALTLPDIGQVFADTDPRWKGCDSSKFMEYAYDVMDGYGYRVGNVDVTLILERPKVAAFKPGMKENIVKLLRTTPGRVNIKARTHERVDSVGELRSLSCHVVLTLVRTDD